MRTRPACALVLLALLLAGCATPPPTAEPAAPTMPAAGPGPSPLADGLSEFESQQRVRALIAEDRERWAEAAWTWEVLTVLRPDHAPYRHRATLLQRRIDAAVADQMERGQAARQRGALDLADTHYLRALALQPQQAQAADALREIERERNRRLYLGKRSRFTASLRNALTPPAVRMPAPAPVRAAVGPDRPTP